MTEGRGWKRDGRRTAEKGKKRNERGSEGRESSRYPPRNLNVEAEQRTPKRR